MIALILDKLSVIVTQPSKITSQVRGVIRIRAKEYTATRIDSKRIEISARRDVLLVGQKFAFELTVDGWERMFPFVGVGMVETIKGDVLTAVYRLEGEGNRRELDSVLHAAAPQPAGPQARKGGFSARLEDHRVRRDIRFLRQDGYRRRVR